MEEPSTKQQQYTALIQRSEGELEEEHEKNDGDDEVEPEEWEEKGISVDEKAATHERILIDLTDLSPKGRWTYDEEQVCVTHSPNQLDPPPPPTQRKA